MPSLPKLPGLSFQDITRSNFHLSHQFEYKNGYPICIKRPGSGGLPLDVDLVTYKESNDLVGYDTTLTYGRVKNPPCPPFIPKYAMYRGKILTFRAFFKESVYNSRDEHYRIRKVNILIFLETDTIKVVEQSVDNAGYMQGVLVRQQKVPKQDGRFYTWKDFNIGKDIAIYSRVYHIVDADAFTREYLLSEGIKLEAVEEMPDDPYILNKTMHKRSTSRVTPIVDDKQRRLLEFDKRVLTFYATWDDRVIDRDYKDCILYYFLIDDTIAIKQVKKTSSGTDPVPLILSRVKVPKNYTKCPENHPAIYLEKSDEEVDEYYQPKDFLIGETVFIFGKRFVLCDCDIFTRNYYDKFLNIKQKEKIVDSVIHKPQTLYIPSHNMFGSPDDTILSCLKLNPDRKVKNMMRYMINDTKVLRYSCEMVSAHPENQNRKFILYYYLRDGFIKIMEIPVDNSGIKGGKYLSSMLVPKQGSSRDNPEYYTPNDFKIGATINIFTQLFKITGADLYVYRYMQSNPQLFDSDTVSGVRNRLLYEGLLKDELQEQITQDCVDLKQNIPLPTYEKDTMRSCLEAMNADAMDSVDAVKNSEEIKKDGVNRPESHTVCPKHDTAHGKGIDDYPYPCKYPPVTGSKDQTHDYRARIAQSSDTDKQKVCDELLNMNSFKDKICPPQKSTPALKPPCQREPDDDITTIADKMGKPNFKLSCQREPVPVTSDFKINTPDITLSDQRELADIKSGDIPATAVTMKSGDISATAGTNNMPNFEVSTQHEESHVTSDDNTTLAFKNNKPNTTD